MTVADRLLILLSCIGIGFFAYVTWQTSVAADRVEIITPFEHKTISLQQDRIIFINGALGKSEISIQQQRIRFVNSPCSSKFCVHQGWADHSGDIRACLPNKISLRLLGQRSIYDGMTF